MRLVFRLFKHGILVRTERYTIRQDDWEAFTTRLGTRHAEELASAPHMVEIEFLDEPNPAERFFRFGTDPRGMVHPIAVKLENLPDA